jgi:hypothetical protein
VGIGIALTREGPQTSGQMRARFVRGPVPGTDPESMTWSAADPVRVPLSPQQIARPFLHEASVDELVVRALHDGKDLAFLLKWDDPDQDDLDGIGTFHDAAAVQLPVRVGTTPPVMMGAPGSPVHILQWRATWQRDLDGGGRTGLDQLYPRAVRDLTPEELLGPKAAAPYYPGRAVGNPLSAESRNSAVEEIVAEGFGSVTATSRQGATGIGVRGNESWRLAISMPMSRTGIGDRLVPGSTWPVAFAIWMGSKRNRGGRKHWANWVGLSLDPQ